MDVWQKQNGEFEAPWSPEFSSSTFGGAGPWTRDLGFSLFEVSLLSKVSLAEVL
jgi:hypothetical protein